MNKIRFPKVLVVGLLVMLTACQAVGQPRSAEVFRPGDTIDGMLLTTGAQDASPVWAYCSAAQTAGNTTVSDCTIPFMVTNLAIGHVFMVADENLSELDWSELTWQFSIDDRPLELESFGRYDFVLPATLSNGSPIREVHKQFTAWDVVLTNLSPGKHTLRGLAQSEIDSYTWVINLSIEASPWHSGFMDRTRN
jgi:hypothetical protein